MDETLKYIPVFGYFIVIIVGCSTIILSVFNKIDKSKTISINTISLLIGFFTVFGSNIKEIEIPMVHIKKQIDEIDKSASQASDIVKEMEELKNSIKNISNETQRQSGDIEKTKKDMTLYIEEIKKEIPIVINIMRNDEKIISNKEAIELNKDYIDKIKTDLIDNQNKYSINDLNRSKIRYESSNEKLKNKIDSYKQHNNELRKKLTILHE